MSLLQRARLWHRELPPRASAAVTVALVLVFVAGVAGARNVYDAWRKPSAATEACEGYVLGAVKSPASAEFGPGPDVEQTGKFGYTISGYVDSQNGFGAMLRNRYVCKVSELGDTWMLVDIQFPDQEGIADD